MSNSNFSIMAPLRPSITVIDPNGGESWEIGTSRTIQWTYTGNPSPFVKIQLLRGTTVSRTINNKAPIGNNGTGSFSWLLPSGLVTGDNFKIRIISTNSAAYRDESEAVFSIYK
jgi:hypothetical protein